MLQLFGLPSEEITASPTAILMTSLQGGTLGCRYGDINHWIASHEQPRKECRKFIYAFLSEHQQDARLSHDEPVSLSDVLFN